MKYLVLSALCVLVAPPALADEAEVAEARRYFEAGKKAFLKTKYGAAIAAFEQARGPSPSPGVTFSLAQAHRLRYFVDRDAADVFRAVKLYREYLSEAPTGRRRKHAVEHLATIEPLITGLRLSETGTKTAGRPPEPTRLMVQVNVADAKVTLNDLEAVPAPLIEEIKPGRHRIKVEAAGYFPVELTRTAVERAIAVIDVELVPKPAKVEMSAPDGATVYVDGQQHAQAPLQGPIALSQGTHRLEVIQAGRAAYARELEVVRGGALTLNVDLERTTQRQAALWLFGASGAVLVAGSVFAGVGFKAAADADETATKPLEEEMALTVDEVRTYQSNKRRRGQARALAASLYSVAAGGLILGAFLYFLDEPNPGVAPAITLDATGAQVSVAFSMGSDN